MNETLMTDTSATTTEAATSSENVTSTPQGEQVADQQQATALQDTDAGQPDKGDGEESKQGADIYGAPEKYEFQPIEGVETDAADIAAFSEFAKDANLSQEAAQALLSKLAPAIAQRQAAMVETMRASWADSSQTDAEFGGAKLSENLAVAKKALDTFGTPELRTLLNESGLGNHPEFIRMFYRAGKAISEDSFVPSGKTTKSDGPRDIAKTLYPNQ